MRRDGAIPFVSVVVPAFNAARTIGACVEALLAQTYPTDAAEVVIVDNGSRDGTAAVLGRYGDRVLAVHEPKRGPSAARNAGIAATRNPLVAFTDADAIPEPGWLEALVAAAAAQPDVAIFGGRIAALVDAAPVARYAERLFDQARAVADSPPYAITANALMRRAVLERLGGFDEALWLGEDVDLGYRAHFDADARFAYVEDAVVRHHNPATPGELFAKGLQHGRASAAILAKHGARLGDTALRRALSRRRYARIVHAAATGIRRKWDRIGQPGSWSDEQTREPVYDALFDTAKQVGLLRSVLLGTD
jgi:glycosyltransferase involved in cell wall biosynthesis